MELTRNERADPLLHRLIEGWKVELAELRARNDQQLDAEQTANLRGRIKQLKACIALGDEPDLIAP